jgi:hypothetical protein
LAIAEVKWERTQSNQEELDWYTNKSKMINTDLVKSEFNALKRIHEQIWDLECQLRQGVEDQLSLEEIGRRAIAIRDYNNKRVKLKNNIAEILDCPVREIKKDHLSE